MHNTNSSLPSYYSQAIAHHHTFLLQGYTRSHEYGSAFHCLMSGWARTTLPHACAVPEKSVANI
ncbi:MAG: hypothetical protein AAF704_03850 [Cyanobacteria bacterium P01_D01_bin.123]